MDSDDDVGERERAGGRDANKLSSGRDDEHSREDFARFLQQYLSVSGDSERDGGPAGASPDAAWSNAPYAPNPYGPYSPCDPLDPYADGGYDDLDDFEDLTNTSQSLDLQALRLEAWQLLCCRLVAFVGADLAARRLLLEAELHLVNSRYRPALVATLALQFATSDGPPADVAASFVDDDDSRGQAIADNAAVGITQDPSAVGLLGRHPWAIPAAVVEMITSYQLGDRDRACALRDRLRLVDRTTLSGHLSKRFEGTSEALELMPQLMSLLKTANEEKKAGARPTRA